MPGPVPKREDQRRRRNKAEIGTARARGASKVVVPDITGYDWHPIAVHLFTSLSESGQSEFYEPSDWSVALYVCEAMSKNLNQGGKFSSMLFTAVLSGLTNLLATEGDRRRLRVELDRAQTEETDASVTAIQDYKKLLG